MALNFLLKDDDDVEWSGLLMWSLIKISWIQVGDEMRS